MDEVSFTLFVDQINFPLFYLTGSKKGKVNLITKIEPEQPVRVQSFEQRSTHISKTFSPTTPLSTHQSIDLSELYNFVVGVEVNG